MTYGSLGLDSLYSMQYPTMNDQYFQNYLSMQNIYQNPADNTSVFNLQNPSFQGVDASSASALAQATSATGAAANISTLKKPEEKKSCLPAALLTIAATVAGFGVWLFSRGKARGAEKGFWNKIKTGWNSLFKKSAKNDLLLHKNAEQNVLEIKGGKQRVISNKNVSENIDHQLTKLGITRDDSKATIIKKWHVNHGEKDNIITAEVNDQGKIVKVIDARSYNTEKGKFEKFDYKGAIENSDKLADSEKTIGETFKEAVENALNNKNNNNVRTIKKYKNIDGTTVINSEGNLAFKNINSDKFKRNIESNYTVGVTNRYNLDNVHDIDLLTKLDKTKFSEEQQNVLQSIIGKDGIKNLKVTQDNIVKGTINVGKEEQK